MKKLLFVSVAIMIAMMLCACGGSAKNGYYEDFSWDMSPDEVIAKLEKRGATYDPDISGLKVDQYNITREVYRWNDESKKDELFDYNAKYLNKYRSVVSYTFDNSKLKEVCVTVLGTKTEEDFNHIEQLLTKEIGDSSSTSKDTKVVYWLETEWKTDFYYRHYCDNYSCNYIWKRQAGKL